MSTANKLTYLNVTKQKLKQAINNIGGEVTDETTFRQYVNQLENAYDRLPKTEFEEGESVTLENTLKGKLDFQDGKVGFGQASQDSTTGKNKLPPFVKGVRLNATNGTEESISTGATTDYIPVNFTTNPDWFLSGLLDTIHTTVWAYNSSKQGLHRSSNQNRTSLAINSSIFTGGTAQGTGDIAYIRVCYRVETGDTGVISDIDNLKMQLEIGSSATAWEPYTGGQASPNPSYPQQIKSVTGNQDVVVSGKNLVEGLELGEINAQTGAESSTSNIVRTINYIPYSRLKSYRQSVNGENLSSGTNLRFYNKDKEYIGYAIFSTNTSITDISITIGTGVTTTDLEPKYFRIRVGTSVLQTDSKYMIATSEDLTYEPYITPTTYQLSLGDIELCKIGNYQDYIYKSSGKWYVHKEIGKFILNGTENWALENSGQGTFRYNITNFYYGNTTNDTNSKCNSFPIKTITNSTTDYGIYGSGTGNYFRIRTQTEMTLANFKTWLSNNNVIFYYQLATSTDTQITDTTLINQLEALYNAHSLNGTTIITSNGNLPMIIKVRGLKGE